MDTTPVTLILTLKTASHGGSDTVAVHRQGRGCDLYVRLVQEEGEGDGCGHVRMVREVSVHGVPALPNWSYEESDVEIDFVGIHHHNNHAYNKQRNTATLRVCRLFYILQWHTSLSIVTELYKALI